MSVGESLAREERPPYISFEKKAVENKLETLRQGHYVAKDVDYVSVTLPGGRDIFVSEANKWLERQETYARNGRIKPEWLEYYKKAYEHWKEGEEIPVNGTAIKGWAAISPAQTEMIIRSGIKTVEDLAGLNDEGLRRLGMGGRDLVSKASSWLNSASDHGKVALQNAALEKQNEQLKTTVESLEEKVDILTKMVQSKETRDESPIVTAAKEKLYDNATNVYAEEVIAPLAEQYEQKFGKPPHHRMKEDTIRRKLQE